MYFDNRELNNKHAMTKKLIWRLANRPTPEEILSLLKSGIVTKDEARGILFSEETEKVREKESLESEVKFLRELVERLSNNRSQIVETIKYVEKPYQKWEWYKPYEVWCKSDNNLNSKDNVAYLTTGTTTGNSTYTSIPTKEGFTAIVTF